MIELTAFTHRERLRGVIARWLGNQFLPDDPPVVKRLINFNAIFVRRVREQFARRLLPAVFGAEFDAVTYSTKGEYKDMITRAPYEFGCCDSPRVERLIDGYRAEPEHFYRETPCDGVLYTAHGGGRLLASSRIKRVRRLAEKCSRRITDSVFGLIKHEAEVLAARRAAAIGVPLDRLLTPPAEREREFVEAERRVVSDIRGGALPAITMPLRINDVLGFKLLGGAELDRRLADFAVSKNDMALVEREEHKGDYNATNFIVTWRPPLDDLLREPLEAEAIDLLRARGMDSDLQGDFERFVREGEREVNIEIIVQPYDEMLESELGVSMHEERIMRQRDQLAYRGPISRNIAVLTQFLFYFALSRTATLRELPIKIWVPYMPDYHDQVLYRLTDFPVWRYGLAL